MKIVGMAQIYNKITSGHLKHCPGRHSFNTQRRLRDKIMISMRLATTRDYLSVLDGMELAK